MWPRAANVRRRRTGTSVRRSRALLQLVEAQLDDAFDSANLDGLACASRRRIAELQDADGVRAGRDVLELREPFTGILPSVGTICRPFASSSTAKNCNALVFSTLTAMSVPVGDRRRPKPMYRRWSRLSTQRCRCYPLAPFLRRVGGSCRRE